MLHRKHVIICPTYNAGKGWVNWLQAVDSQKLKGDVIVIDSGSLDDTVLIAKQLGCQVIEIPKVLFNHGSTRNKGVESLKEGVEFLIFLTQDAILANENSIENIIKVFDDPSIGAVCGRQLPRVGSKPIEAHARKFNYPDISSVKSFDDAQRLGIKTVFMSNSFAAYRRQAFEDVEGFPADTIFAEDMAIAAKMILKGWKIAYCAEAAVYHSHNYSISEEFERYFDAGVFHNRESWIARKFGGTGGEGFKFVISETRYMLSTGNYFLVPEVFLRTIVKYIGFKLGMLESYIPKKLKRKMSMNKNYWK